MPIMLISYGLEPNDGVDPTGLERVAHSVATHDSINQAAVPWKAQEDAKSAGSGSIQSLSGVTASKVCQKWQHPKSVGSGSI